MGKKKSWLSNPQFRKQAIILLVLTFCMQYICNCLGSDSYNILVVWLPQIRGWDTDQIALAYTIGGVAAIIGGVVCGALIAKRGPRLVGGVLTLLMGLGAFCMGAVPSYAAYFVGEIIIRIGGTALLYCLASFTSNWFVVNRGRALGINTMGGPLNTATSTALLSLGISTIGFSGTYMVVGVIVMVIGVLIFLLMRDKPEDMGLFPDGIEHTQEEIDAINAAEAGTLGDWNLKRIFTNKDSLLYIIGMAGVSFVMICMMIYFIPRFLACGYDYTFVVSAFSIGGLCAIPISYVYGWIDDKVNTPVACVIYTVILALTVASMIFAEASIGLVYFCAFGVASACGGLPNLCPSIAAFVYGREHFMACYKYSDAPKNLVSAFCASFVALFVSAAVAKGQAEAAGYVNAFWVLLVISILCTACFAVMGKKSYDQKLEEMTFGKRKQ